MEAKFWLPEDGCRNSPVVGASEEKVKFTQAVRFTTIVALGCEVGKSVVVAVLDIRARALCIGPGVEGGKPGNVELAARRLVGLIVA